MLELENYAACATKNKTPAGCRRHQNKTPRPRSGRTFLQSQYNLLPLYCQAKIYTKTHRNEQFFWNQQVRDEKNICKERAYGRWFPAGGEKIF